MTYAIIAILFALLCLNPAMAMAYWLGGFSFSNERNIKIVKIVQVINAVLTIIAFALTIALFDQLALGAKIQW